MLNPSVYLLSPLLYEILEALLFGCRTIRSNLAEMPFDDCAGFLQRNISRCKLLPSVVSGTQRPCGIGKWQNARRRGERADQTTTLLIALG